MPKSLLSTYHAGSRSDIYQRHHDLMDKYVDAPMGTKDALTLTHHLESARRGEVGVMFRNFATRGGVQMLTNDVYSPFGVAGFRRPPAPFSRLAVSSINGLSRHISTGAGMFNTGFGAQLFNNESALGKEDTRGYGIGLPEDPAWLIGGNDGQGFLDLDTRTIQYDPQYVESIKYPAQYPQFADTRGVADLSLITVQGNKRTSDWSGNTVSLNTGNSTQSNYGDTTRIDEGMRRDNSEQSLLTGLYEVIYMLDNQIINFESGAQEGLVPHVVQPWIPFLPKGNVTDTDRERFDQQQRITSNIED